LHAVQKSEEYAAQMRVLAPEMLASNKQTYDLPRHTVTVTEIDNMDLMHAGGTYLGMNMVRIGCVKGKGRGSDLYSAASRIFHLSSAVRHRAVVQPSPRSQTLACSSTAIRSPSLPF